MKWLLALMLALCAMTARADSTMFFTNEPSVGGLKGLHIDRPTDAFHPSGICFDWGAQPAWGMGLDCLCSGDYTGTPDLVLAFSSTLLADNLRLRADDARMEFGPRAGHPVMPFQLNIAAGRSREQPMGGLSVGTYGYQLGLFLYNRGGSKRNSISFQNNWMFVTDSQENGVADFKLSNPQIGKPVFTVQPNNDMKFCAGKLGFFDQAPTAKPTVAGNWSDGSAGKSLVAALVKLGLVTDGTSENASGS